MKYFKDDQLEGHALIFSGPLELIQAAYDANQGDNPYLRAKRADWPGRRGSTWKDMLGFLHQPWDEAVRHIMFMCDQIKSSVPEPKSIKRRRRWNDTDGDVDVDRYLSGDPEMFRDTTKVHLHASRNVSLVSNLDSDRDFRVNPSGLWYRSGVAIAVADMLEQAGYNVEIWIWTRGACVYPEPHQDQFIAYRPKQFGQPVDMHAMADAMSAWFTINAIHGAGAACPEKPDGLGAAYPAFHNETEVEKSGIGEWIKYLDIEDNVQKVAVPMVTSIVDGRGGWSTYPVDAARKVLAQIKQADR